MIFMSGGDQTPVMMVCGFSDGPGQGVAAPDSPGRGGAGGFGAGLWVLAFLLHISGQQWKEGD
jgi:hypothetical protein